MPNELAKVTPMPLTEAPAVTPEQVDLIKRTIAKDATADELKLYFYDCQRQGVHPLDKLIHFTKRAGKYTPITSIDFMRSRAADSNEYAGNDDAAFVESEDGKHPTSATVTVYRIVQGQRCAFTATARWSEYLPEQAFMWKKMPFTMLGKCAEALALRKAFPRQLSGLYAAEEMAQSGRKPPEEAGEMHEADPEEQAKTISLAGEITEEKETHAFFWYKINTLVGKGEIKTVFVKSPKETDSGRLAEKVGYLASLKVLPTDSHDIFILSDVLQVRAPKPTAQEKARPEPSTAPQTPLQAELRELSEPKRNVEPLSPDYRLIQKSQEIEIHKLRKSSGISDDDYYALLGFHNAKHAKELTRSAYVLVRKGLEDYAMSVS